MSKIVDITKNRTSFYPVVVNVNGKFSSFSRDGTHMMVTRLHDAIVYRTSDLRQANCFTANNASFFVNNRVVCCTNNVVSIFVIETSRRATARQTLVGQSYVLSPDDRFIAVRSGDEVSVHHTSLGAALFKIQGGSPSFSPDSNFLIVPALVEKEFDVYSTSDWSKVASHKGSFQEYSPDSKYLMDKQGSVMHRLSDWKITIPVSYRYLSFSPDCKHIALQNNSGNCCKLYRTADLADMRNRSNWNGDYKDFSGEFTAFSPDGSLIAVQSAGKVNVHRLSDQRSVMSVSGEYRAFSPDGKHIVFAENGAIKMYDVVGTSIQSTVVTQFSLKHDYALSATFSRDGKLLCCCDGDEVRIISMTPLKVVYAYSDVCYIYVSKNIFTVMPDKVTFQM